MLAGCLGLAAASLLLPHALSYDAWGWAVWGREVLHLDLNTRGAQSWKPLPALLDAVFALAGRAEPDLWLLVARTGALLALALAYRLAARLAGRLAGVVTVVWLVLVAKQSLGFGWVSFFAAGWSEGLLAALVLGAIERHLDAHREHCLLGLFGASLIRPEAWVLLGAYAVFLWRAEPGRRRLVALLVIAVSALWLGPDLWGSGGLLHASARARADVPPDIAHAAHPGLLDVAFLGEVLGLPVSVAALAAVVFAVHRRERTALGLAGVALAWLAVVAAMAEIGYPGIARFLVVTIALAAVLAGVGCAWTLGLARGPRPRLLLAVALLAAQLSVALGRAVVVGRELAEAGHSARLDRELPAALRMAGGAQAVRSCGPTAVNPYEVTAVSWGLGAGARVTYLAAAATTVLRSQADNGGRTAPALPMNGSRFRLVGRTRSWEVLSRCPARARLRVLLRRSARRRPRPPVHHANRQSRRSTRGTAGGQRAERSAKDAGVPEGVAARLGKDRQAARTESHGNPGQEPAGPGVKRVDLAVVAPGQPQHLPVGRDAAHVRAATTRDAPRGDHPLGREGDHRHGAHPAIGDVERARVPAHGETVGIAAGADEPSRGEGARVEDVNASGRLVGDVEALPVG